jgi:hypothetical protein
MFFQSNLEGTRGKGYSQQNKWMKRLAYSSFIIVEYARPEYILERVSIKSLILFDEHKIRIGCPNARRKTMSPLIEPKVIMTIQSEELVV